MFTQVSTVVFVWSSSFRTYALKLSKASPDSILRTPLTVTFHTLRSAGHDRHFGADGETRQRQNRQNSQWCGRRTSCLDHWCVLLVSVLSLGDCSPVAGGNATAACC